MSQDIIKSNNWLAKVV